MSTETGKTYSIDEDIQQTMSRILDSGKANGRSSLIQIGDSYRLILTVKRTEVDMTSPKPEVLTYLKGVAHGLGLEIVS